MNILHIAVASSFTEGMSYQENILVDLNVKDGHTVTIVTNCNKFENGALIDTDPEDMILQNGVRLIRVKYDKIINSFFSGKIRKVKKLYSILCQLKPDVILFHGACGYELLTVAKYKKENPRIKFYVDSHEDYNNSGRNFLSKYVLHGVINKYFVQKALPFIDKVFYISLESFDFVNQLYGIPDEVLEFLPLGGIIIEGKQYLAKRKRVREYLGLQDENILFVHSGKMDKLKRTSELLKAFNRVKSEKLRFILIGSIPKEMDNELTNLINNDYRVNYLGWKSANELFDFLCAADMYLQPGSQSATLQNAICCGCPVMIYPYKSHKPFLKGNGFYVEGMDDIVNVFMCINENPQKLNMMSKASYRIAHELLDYNKQATRLYQ